MNRKKPEVFILFFTILLLTNLQSEAQTLFSLVPAKDTHIDFENRLIENDSLHVMNYEYLYNGNGVGVADFNNDGLNDLFFSANTTSYKLYINKGGFKFEDITVKANVKGNGTWATGVSIADVNGDGLPDIYVCHSGKYPASKLSNELFIHQGVKDGHPVFKEMAKEYGLDAPGTQSTQAAFFDYDRDGDLDMFLLNHSNHTYNPLLNTRKIRATFSKEFGNRLFRNDVKNGICTFQEVTTEAGIVNNPLNFGLSVTISDLNKDGWPDIYTTSDYSEQDYLYINNKDGSFKESIRNAMGHISKYAMGADIADYNNDGLSDVITLDMLPEDNHRQKMLRGPDEYDMYHLLVDSGYYHQQMRNMLQLNSGAGPDGTLHFSEIGQLAGISNTDWSWSALLADFDNDGWKDLFVSNGYLRDFTDMDFLKYTVANAQKDALKSGTVVFKTYDLVKKMPSNKLHNYIFQNNHNLTFTDRSTSWGIDAPSVSNSSAYADLDNDGDLDLIVNNINEPVMIYRNNAELLNSGYIRIQLIGKGMNTSALGAKVYIETDSVTQYQEKYGVRGYQSSVDPVLLFGLGKSATIKSVRVIWPDGKETHLHNLKANQLLTLKQADAHETASSTIVPPPLFTDVSRQSDISFKHTENQFIDFKGEPLMPYQLSKMGPALAKADVNKDGFEDVFVGGAIEQSGKLFLGKSDGRFEPAPVQPWEKDAAAEDVNAVFFDSNKDGNLDLWIVSGGNEYDNGAPEYQDRLYLGDGTGQFTKAENALPQMLSSKQAVAVADFDKDGDEDIFVGGMGLPGSFPLSSRSWLLRNDLINGAVKFTDITSDLSDGLVNPGMVSSACWQDIDADGYPELIIAGHWMPIRIFKNLKGKLTDISESAGLKNTEGLWSAIIPADVNSDGKMDFIAGNWGLNNQFKASPDMPVTIYASDFNNDGALDPVMSYYIQGKNYPSASRDELLDQIVQMRKRFVKYADYADITIDELFSKEQLEKSAKLYCRELASSILLNDGKGAFQIKHLPVEAQFSTVFVVLWDDFDKDGKNDLLLSGNFYPYRVQLGKNDAGHGLFLKGNGTGEFSKADESGFYVPGDVRGMIQIKSKSGKNKIVIVKNDDYVQVLEY
ncbi:VCBS repeat-containing protein [Rubrolithibacter danxiaensis]|uniref:VCBS repeat-containing protein n=1 Tax=Rubrolithibacter danxiaensis TaxID=3390805 RepID=UPI003BF7A06F